MQHITFPDKLTETQIIMTTGYACRYSQSKTNQKLKFEKTPAFPMSLWRGLCGSGAHTRWFVALNYDHWVRLLRQHHIILYDVNNIIIWYNCLNYIVSLYYINAVLGSQVWSWSRAKQRSPLARDPSTACFPQRAIKSDIRQHIGLP